MRAGAQGLAFGPAPGRGTRPASGLALGLTLWLALGLAPIAAAEGRGLRLALVVGVNEYETLGALRGAALDASLVGARIRSAGYDEVLLLSDIAPARPPESGELRQAMASLAAAARGRAVEELAFFFAGHGLRIEERNCLCLSDADPAAGRGMISLEEDLAPWIRSLSPRLAVLLIDACREEAIPSRAAFQPSPIEWRAGKGSARAGSSTFVLFAALPGAYSYESPDGSGGFFTKALLDSFDRGESRLIDIVESLGRDIPLRSQSAYGKAQRPSVSGDFDPIAEFSVGRKAGAAAKEADILVSTKPSGAEVFIDGEKIGLAPLLISRPPARSLVVEARLGELYAFRDIATLPGSLASVELELQERLGRLFFSTDRRITGVSIDGGDFLPLQGPPLLNLPRGERAIKLRAEGDLAWSATLDVRPGATTTAVPRFKPVGSIDIRLPEGAAILLREGGEGREYVFAEAALFSDAPAGRWEAKNIDENFEPWSSAFELPRGSSFLLAPSLSPNASWLRNLELGRLRASLPAIRAARGGLDLSSYLSFGAAAACGIAAGALLLDYLDARKDYDAAGPGSDFSALRSRILDARALGLTLAVSAGGLSLLGGSFLLLGPRPAGIESRIAQLEALIGGER